MSSRPDRRSAPRRGAGRPVRCARGGSPGPATGTARCPCHRPAAARRTPAPARPWSRPSRHTRCGRSTGRRPGTDACWPGSAACPATPAGCAAAQRRTTVDADGVGEPGVLRGLRRLLADVDPAVRVHPADAPAIVVLRRERPRTAAARPAPGPRAAQSVRDTTPSKRHMRGRYATARCGDRRGLMLRSPATAHSSSLVRTRRPSGPQLRMTIFRVQRTRCRFRSASGRRDRPPGSHFCT